MNSVDGKYLKTVKATDLKQGTFYDCRVIKKIESKDYGDNYLLKSKNFQLYLPRRFSTLRIEEEVVGRQFRIRGFMSNSRFPNKRSPLIEFSIAENFRASAAEEEKNARRGDVNRNFQPSNNNPKNDPNNDPIDMLSDSGTSNSSLGQDMQIIDEEGSSGSEEYMPSITA